MTMREGSGEEKLYLDVPFPDKEQVKALGARWDRDARSWYAPNHLDVESFTHWLALLPADDDPLLCIAGLPQCCWKCGEDTTAVIACEDEDQLIFAHAEVLQVIASQFSESDLATFSAAPLRPRFSRTLGHSAWSNGCIACGALLGGFPLFEDFAYCQKHWGNASDRRIGQNPTRRALRRIQPRGLGHRQKLVVCYRIGIASCIQQCEHLLPLSPPHRL
jgi:hypothetical protein